jgi:CBS domain-containing protein
MFSNNDFSDEPNIQTAGVLPVCRPAEHRELRSNDAALHAMTDFTRKPAVTVDPGRQIDAALEDMIRLGVRAMLVVNADSVTGLITSYDIEGTRTVQFAEPPHVRRREDIRVCDIMTKWKDLPTLDWHTVQTSRVSDLMEIFDGIGVMHLLVVESGECGAEIVRGLISRSRIQRQLHGAQYVPHAAAKATHRGNREEGRH